jgi:hypothetical protein
MKKRGRPPKRFSGMTKSIDPMLSLPLVSLARGTASRWSVPGPSYRTRREDRALPIVLDEFRPAIPRWVGRHQSPSPLYRQAQNKAMDAVKEMIYRRTVDCVLTTCLTPGDNPTP